MNARLEGAAMQPALTNHVETAGAAASAEVCEEHLANAVIMVVDDHPPNVILLEEMLRRRGYDVRSFTRGKAALHEAAFNPPDLILLDINMPEMNGYEVCKQLKDTPALAEIPVVFLSALSQTSDKVQAFRSGGVDYVSKPFQLEEVHSRVATHLKLHRLQKALANQNTRLEAMVECRTRALHEANERLAILDHAKSDFLRLIEHELRTPLNGLLGTGELMMYELESNPAGADLAEMFLESRDRLLAIVENALLLTQVQVESERYRAEPVCLARVVAQAVQETQPFTAARRVRVENRGSDQGWTRANHGLLVTAFRSLLETAIKFSREGDTVTLDCDEDPCYAAAVIRTTRGTIPAMVAGRFFDPFAIGEASTSAGDLGLGPALAHRIVALSGGSVKVANLEPAGIELKVSCPCLGSGIPQA